jgi:oxygen-independent coproporphyrinogen-3 oxidase
MDNLYSTLGLYLHIPWCVTRCIYCDFNTYIDGTDTLKHRYHQALLREIYQAGAALGKPALNTIFIGGGTPTTLPPSLLLELVDAIKLAFALRADAEVTIEANPGTLTLDDLRALRQGGFNRLSLGVQSFNDGELGFLSRLHNADTARNAVAHAQNAGFANISLDLIFNLPQQTLAAWQFNLQEAIKLDPDHFSLYSLIVEPGTPLHRQVSAGVTPAPDDDGAAEMYNYAIDVLNQAGYTHYEISNWARNEGEAPWQCPPLAAAHNLIYWRNQPYLGIGAGAFGTINGQRWMNVKRPQTYIDRIEKGTGLGPARDEGTVEQLDRTTTMAEQMLLGLRLVREGVSAAGFLARFGIPLAQQYGAAIEQGLGRGLLEWIETPAGSHLRLTRQGCFLANQVMIEFMP